MEYTIEIPTGEEEELIDDELMVYNIQQAPPTQEAPFEKICRCAKDEDGNVIGGVLACMIMWHVLSVESVWVSEEWRGMGFAAELLEEVEEEARERGCHLVYLDTFDFQAKGFYEKQGYRVFGELKDMPKGHVRYYMCKEL